MNVYIENNLGTWSPNSLQPLSMGGRMLGNSYFLFALLHCLKYLHEHASLLQK